jgi:putative ABC transport system permease protein
MNWLALKMLFGDRAKFLGLIFGVTFATLLMSQQISIFIGIVARAGSQILDVRDADLWVMDNKTRFLDESRSLRDTDLQRVRGIAGVEWAVKMYKGEVGAVMENGNFRGVILEGIDDDTLVGAPAEMVAGSIGDLRQPDAVIVDTSGYTYMWPGEEVKLGRVFEINDHRAVLVGVCKTSAPFETLPVMFTRYSQASGFARLGRNLMTFILVKGHGDEPKERLAERISAETGLMALTKSQFFWKTIGYFLSSTGIPVNFGITIGLGFIVGVAIAGQTFYLFVIENLKYFGSLKAMGVNNRRIVRMILLQTSFVGVLGYSLGTGCCAIMFEVTSSIPHLAGIGMTWQVSLGVACSVVLIVLLSIALSVQRVLKLEPAIVFRG